MDTFDSYVSTRAIAVCPGSEHDGVLYCVCGGMQTEDLFDTADTYLMH